MIKHALALFLSLICGFAWAIGNGPLSVTNPPVASSSSSSGGLTNACTTSGGTLYWDGTQAACASANQTVLGNLYVGTATPVAATKLSVQVSANNYQYLSFRNTNSGASAVAGFSAAGDATSNNIYQLSDAAATSANTFERSSAALVYGNGGSYNIGAYDSRGGGIGGNIRFFTSPVNSAGNVYGDMVFRGEVQPDGDFAWDTDTFFIDASSNSVTMARGFVSGAFFELDGDSGAAPTCAADGDVGRITRYVKGGGVTISMCLCTKLSSVYTVTALGTGDCT